MSVRKLQEQRSWAWHVAVPILKPLVLATTRRDWRGGDRIPATGGCLLVANHISHVDPITVGHLVWDHGRIPHYLAKSQLFRHPALRVLMTAAGQIPVERLTTNAVGAYAAAVAAVRRGECVVVYPEGTITRDPDGWPMTGKSGAARIALATGCPVIPIGQWGAQDLLAPYARKPDLFPRKTVTMKVGDPVDLADLLARERTPTVVRETTDRIMAAIVALVEEVRGEQAPTERFDMRRLGSPGTGDPRHHQPEEDPS